ncbi:MAG: cobalt-precorrin 5A hydrolase [Armatimonadota bacterium]
MVRFERAGEIILVTASPEGAKLGLRLLADFPGATLWAAKPYLPEVNVYEGSLRDFIGARWGNHAAIIGIMASGILVRAIAPWVDSKFTDPAVVAIDVAGRFAISLLSGHEGGANRLAEQVCEILGAIPVITTGSEAQRRIVVGIGCRRGVSTEKILTALDRALAEQGHRREEIAALASIDLKADEPGLRQAAAQMGVPLRIVSRSRIRALQEALRENTFAETQIGVAAVCVPAALLISPHAELLAPKLAQDGVTVALAQDTCGWSDLALEDATT